MKWHDRDDRDVSSHCGVALSEFAKVFIPQFANFVLRTVHRYICMVLRSSPPQIKLEVGTLGAWLPLKNDKSMLSVM